MESHMFEEELKKERRLVGNLIHEIDYKNQQLSKMEHRYNDTTSTLRQLVNGLIEKINTKDSELQDWELRYNRAESRYMKIVRQLMREKTMLHDEFVKEIRKVKSENCKLKGELMQRTKELEKCKSHYDQEQRKSYEIEVKEDLPCQNAEVEKILNAQDAALKKELEEKSEALQAMESDYNCLAVRDNLTNQELQDARKEAINGLKDILNGRTTLGIKRMGEIDQKAFEVACSIKFPDEDWQEVSAKLCSQWEQNLKDSNWHPYKMIHFEGKLQEIVDEDDEKLKELRNEYGEVAFEAVCTALMEINEYNASGRYAVSEIWNKKEGRRAKMKEIVEYIIKQLKANKHKRKRTC